jgi:hypothetical protein
MAATEDTLTLALQGDVSLDDLARALTGFRDLVHSLTSEVDATTSVRWLVEDLEVGSAIATARGEVSREEDRGKVVEVIRRYERVGRALELGEAIPGSEPSKRSAREILRVIEGGRVRAVRFETASEDHEISAAVLRPEREGVGRAKGLQPVVGAVRGRVQSISNRGGLRFTLYDLIEDRAVSCYLGPGMEESMRDAWGRVAIVEGMVRRDAATGRPAVVRSVSRVELVSEGRPKGYRDAIGSAPQEPGEMLPEEAVRKTRDA